MGEGRVRAINGFFGSVTAFNGKFRFERYFENGIFWKIGISEKNLVIKCGALMMNVQDPQYFGISVR